MWMLKKISIHALTRSATMVIACPFEKFCISIHALTRSATGASTAMIIYNGNFNPRTHKECDGRFKVHNFFISISIHALTRSATCERNLFSLSFGFQSTHSQGVRLYPVMGEFQ